MINNEIILNIIDDFIINQKIQLNKLELQDFIGYKVFKESLLTILMFLKESPDLRFTILTDLFATDFPNKIDRFEIVYSLLSLKLNKRILLKLEVGENEMVPSATKIFKAACWYEREI